MPAMTDCPNYFEIKERARKDLERRLEEHKKRKAGTLTQEEMLAIIARLERQLDEVMEERDLAQDALQQTHIALGGDGEWVTKLPPEPPPHSGDLHFDVPALAAEMAQTLTKYGA